MFFFLNALNLVECSGKNEQEECVQMELVMFKEVAGKEMEERGEGA